jgi:hypothetical protein
LMASPAAVAAAEKRYIARATAACGGGSPGERMRTREAGRGTVRVRQP